MNKGCLVGLAAFVGIIIIAGLIVVVAFVGNYNRMVTQDENCRKAWANVETVLQRRFDLIPNLVNTVKGYANQEKTVFEEVTRLRSQWAAAKTVDEKAQAANALEGALGRLILVAENYPELKSSQNFLALQDELAGTENRISVERRRYNEAVQSYNVLIRRFPTTIFARWMGFERKTPFEAAQGAAQPPTVDFTAQPK